MKILIALLLSCLAVHAASLNITLTIPSLGVTNVPGVINGIGTKTSEYPNTGTMHSNYLFLIADPSTPTNRNVAFGQLLTSITGSVTNGSAITNILQSSFVSPTNGVSSATAIDFNVPEATTNITGNIAFTSIINPNPTNYNYAIRHVINNSGGNLTLTVLASWRTDPNLRTSTTTYTMTNNCQCDVLVSSQINFDTNVNVIYSCQ